MTGQWTILAVCIAQFCWLAYNPLRQLPTAKDEEAGRHFLALLRAFDGEVYVPCSGYYATLAGKKAYASVAGMFDVLRSRDEEVSKMIVENLDKAFREQKFSAVFMPTRFIERIFFGRLYVLLENNGYTRFAG